MNAQRMLMWSRRLTLVAVIGLIVGLVSACSDPRRFSPEDRVVQVTVETLDHDSGCASAQIKVNNEVIDNLGPFQTPWNYEFQALDRNQVEVFVCPSCDDCSVRCTIEDRLRVSIAVDGVQKGSWDSVGLGDDNDFECMFVTHTVSD